MPFKTGLWATDARTDTPRGPAYVLRAMYQLTGDTGSTKRTFSPGMLDYTVSGLQPAASGDAPNSGGQHMLFQNSSGKFFLFVWNSQQAPGGTTQQVTITFNSHTMTSVVHYDLTNNPASNMTAISTQNAVRSLSFGLNASVHLFVITY